MIHIQGAAEGRRPHSRNKKWVAGQGEGKSGSGGGERWERGGHRRRGGRGRVQGHHGTHLTVPNDFHEDTTSATEDEAISGAESGHEEQHEEQHEDQHEEQHEEHPDDEPVLETPEERERFYQELVKQREVERKRAIAEGKMDDPEVKKHLKDAITMVGTCMDMCPRFERYRRERENNLDKWEVVEFNQIPGTKRVDHKRAVKIYERAAGAKTLPSDLRPPPVLKKTLDYLFHDLIVRGGFTHTYDFIRDRSRAVRNDFTIQHESGPLAIECHDRCARFHILALHLERGSPRFSVALEEQQLMNTLQSLKEFYAEQRGRYQSPTELEMRVYHRLIHIRDQVERHDNIPDEILHHDVFKLTTQFRERVQQISIPITKTSKLVVDMEAMQIFSQLADVLRKENNIVMIYLVACILEHLFGKDAIEDIESIRGDLSIPDIIDGISKPLEEDGQTSQDGDALVTESPSALTEVDFDGQEEPVAAPQPLKQSATEWLTNNFGGPPAATTQLPPVQPVFGSSTIGASSSTPATSSLFSNMGQTSGTGFFGSGSSLPSSTSAPAKSAFGNLATKTSAFGGATFGASTSASSTSVFGNGSSSQSVFGSTGASSSPFAPSAISSASANKNSGSIFSTPLSFAPSAEQAKPPTTLSAQPTWPAESSGFASTPQSTLFSTATSSSSAPAPAPAPVPTLNPFAPSFVPPQAQPLHPSSSSSSTSTPATQATDGKPAVPTPTFSDPFSGSSTGFAAPPSQTSVAPTELNGFSLPPPATGPSETAAVVSEENVSEQMGPPPTPSRIIERRQTLWDLPGSSSPFSRLKEDRMTYTPSPGTPTGPSSPISPTAAPPALNRPNHINLPPTPTARWFESAEASLSRKQSMVHFPSLSIPTPGAADILSPIHLTTPTGKNAPSTSNGLLLQTGTPALERQSTMESFAASSPVNRTPDSASKQPKPVLEIRTNGISSPPSPSASKKGKAKETPADLEQRAASFARTCLAVKQCWVRWRQRREASKAWEEACKRSESYQAEVQRTRRLSSSLNGRPADFDADADKMALAKKRRVSSVVPVDTAQVRRVKRRKSAQLAAEPLTDEALAQRLQENREENERRWAQGSFRRTVIDRLKARLPPDTRLPEWCIWLSTNSVNDKTAIWLEHKFDMPASGHWVSENVFCIPAFDAPEQQGSPGLIIFERSPLEGVDDEIERKYRVIDDCARLRDILETRLPPEEEHFLPCLLVINWSEKADDENTRDFVDMTHKAVKDGLLKHVSYFSVSATAKELDKKFAEVVNATPLDTDDRLAVKLSLKDIRKFLVNPVESAVSDFVDSCWSDGEFNWSRYDRVVVAVEEIMNSALRAILSLFPDSPPHVSVEIPEELLPQPGELGRGYATSPFAESLAKLVASSAQDILGNKLASPVTVPRDTLDAAVQDLENAIETQAKRLRQLAADAALKASLGPSPKRRASQEDLRLNGSVSSKRLRLSPEDGVVDIDVDGASVSPPPSTSGATDAGEKPLVTVAMLRALTRDVLKTYGSAK
ncbi:SAC3/GANP/Nin1/mts3/eIF-3 p25 family-domain-containing protein [Trametes polyzona]|nr:SAC3/GANP/Nin1/mts3/eIF-3 p25 family-domain-containing protein [Trametes polyzona]